MRASERSRIALVLAVGLALAAVAEDAAAYSDKVRAPGFDGRYYPGVGEKGSPQAIFERSCTYIHSSGNLLLHMSNAGFLGDFFGNFCNRPSAEWPPGSNNEYLFMGGLWVGAVDADGNPHVSTGAYEVEFLPDFNDPIDRVYTSFEGAREGARFSLTGDATSADDDGDATGPTDTAHINEDFLNGRDDDGDGLIDEDYEAVSQQMFASEYTDYNEVATNQNAEHVPLFLRVQQRSFSWSSGGAENMIGVDYKIWNDGNRPLRDIYLGFFVDSDVGPADDDTYPNMFQDDLVGFAEIDTVIVDERPATPAGCRRTQVKLQLAYMRDVADTDHNFQETGDVPGWFGGLFLGHSTDPQGLVAPAEVGIRTFVWFTQGGAIRDPENDFERYELLSRSARTDDGKFIQENPTDARDYRYVMAVGPFAELLPDTSLTFQVAFVIGEGFEGANGLKRNAINAQRIFNGDLFNLDGDNTTGQLGREKCVFCAESGSAAGVIDDDCDPNSPEAPCVRGDCTWIDGDCANPAHACTGVDGREGAVRWIGVSPPPAPNLSISTTGRTVGVTNEDLRCLENSLPTAPPGEVVLTWDNLVDKSTNPITGAKNFKGYRVWKAAGWDRESESVPTELFQLLGDFSVQGDSSCVELVAYTRESTSPFNATLETFDYCRPSYEAFERLLAGLDRLEDSPCPIELLDGRPTNEALFEDYETVDNRDIGSCPLGYLVDRSVGSLPIDETTCVEQSLPVARLNPALPDIQIGGQTFPPYQIVDSTFTVCDTVYCKGYYSYQDQDVLDGYPYFYVVTAYSETIEDGPLGAQVVELHTRPSSNEEAVVFPSTAPSMSIDRVTVVPNPYLAGSSWDLRPNPTDPTGTKIAFNNLPDASVVRIFTLSGDLVETLTPDTQDGGSNYWDMISRNGQNVVSGIYLYSVESPMGSTVGKVVVVR